MVRRALHRLSTLDVKSITRNGRHSDGGNLYLSIAPNGGRRWTFLYAQRGSRRPREIGIGPAPGLDKAGLSLTAARRVAQQYRELLHTGVDPLTYKRTHKPSQTFGDFADALLADITGEFRNPVHRAQWKSTLETHAAPLRPMALRDIDTEAVLKVLKPIWTTIPETASRLRGRIERVLAAATAKGLRSGPNPAQWRNHLDQLLPKRQKLKRGHMKALAYGDLPAFVADLRKRNSISALALEFLTLTAARTGEVVGARWSEIDLGAKLWEIPAERMKAARPHRVPLTDRAITILKSLIVPDAPPKPEDCVFPGGKKGKPLSSMAMLELLRGMRGHGNTVHGMRSAFKDWATDTTSFQREIIEQALAHVIDNATERAYRRGDALQKRRELMAAWEQYLAGTVGKVVALKRRASR